MEHVHPAHRRAELAATIRYYRERAKISRPEAARLLGCTPSKIGDLELGRSRPKSAELEKLLVHYGVSSSEITNLLMLAQVACRRKPPGTYLDLDVSSVQRRIMDVEAQAVSATYYSAELVPPPLRVLSYADAALVDEEPDDARRRRLASLYVSRRHHLGVASTDAPLRYWCFLGEAALYSGIGGRSTMIEQLGHLRHLAATLPQLELRLVPLGVGGHSLLGQTTTLYAFRSPAPLQVVTETLNQYYFHRSASTVRETSRSFSRLAERALNRADTITRISKVAEVLSTRGQVARVGSGTSRQ